MSSLEKLIFFVLGIISQTAVYQNKSNAIGFSFCHFSEVMVRNGKIKNISVEGIAPTMENIKDGTCPFVNEFYAITLEVNNAPQTSCLNMEQEEKE